MNARDRWAWLDQAACAKPDVDPNLFFPESTSEANDNSKRAVEMAREICRGCVVRETCSQFPFRDDRGHNAQEAGVWGAWTPENRDATRREIANRARRGRPRKSKAKQVETKTEG